MQDNRLVNNGKKLNKAQSKNYNGAVDTDSVEKGEGFIPTSISCSIGQRNSKEPNQSMKWYIYSKPPIQRGFLKI